MADVFASAPQMITSGFKTNEWLALNLGPTPINMHTERVLHDGCFEGHEEVPITRLPQGATFWFSEERPALLPVMRPRTHAAIILRQPERWRANSTLSFYYKPLFLPSGALAVVDYVEAMTLAASERAPEAFAVVPLFRQIARPVRGSRFAIPLQFAADLASAGAGGLAFSDDHLAVGYLSALQALAHSVAAQVPDAGLPAAFQIISFLLSDFAWYAYSMPTVATVVEHLRETTRAEDMLQYMLSGVISKRPFAMEERWRTLETMLKRTFKLHESILTEEACPRLLASLVMVPLFFTMHRGNIKPTEAATHFALTRSKAHEMILNSTVDAADDAAKIEAAIKESCMAEAAEKPTKFVASSVAGTRVRLGLRYSREADLLRLILSMTGLRLESAAGVAKLLEFCSDRTPIYDDKNEDNDAEDVAQLGAIANAAARRKAKGNAIAILPAHFKRGGEEMVTADWRLAARPPSASPSSGARSSGRFSSSSASSIVSSGSSESSRGSRVSWGFGNTAVERASPTQRLAIIPAAAAAANNRFSALAPPQPVAMMIPTANNRFSALAPPQPVAPRAVSPPMTAKGISNLAQISMNTLATSPISALEGSAAPKLLVAPKPKRWRVNTLGQLADLIGFGLQPPRPNLPFILGTACVHMGQPRDGTALGRASAARITAARIADGCTGGNLINFSPLTPLSETSESSTPSRANDDTTLAIDDEAPPIIESATGTLSIVLDHSVLPATTEKTTELDVLVSLRAPSFVVGAASSEEDEAQPIGANLVFVIDCSGSMGGEKMEAAKATVRTALTLARDVDSVAVVAFGLESPPTLVLPLTRISSYANAGLRDAAFEAVAARLLATGGTEIFAALAMALEELKPCENGTSAIIVLTDGQDGRTVQVVPPSGLSTARSAEIAAAIGEKHSYMLPVIELAASRNIVIHTLGFGADHDAALLNGLASAAEGTFSYVENTDEEAVAGVFIAVMGASMTCVTRSAEITFNLPAEAPPMLRIARVAAGAYSCSVAGDGRSARVSFGALAADEARDVLVTLIVPPLDVDGPSISSHALLSAVASLSPLIVNAATNSGTPLELHTSASLRRSVAGALFPPRSEASVKVDLIRARYIVTGALADMLKRSEAGEYSEAAAVLDDAITRLQDSVSCMNPVNRALVDDLLAIRSRTVGAEGLGRRGLAATARLTAAAHSTQRGGAGGAAAQYMASGARSLLAKGGIGRGFSGGSRGGLRYNAYSAHFAAEVGVKLETCVTPAALNVSGATTTTASAAQLLALAETPAVPRVRLTGMITTTWSAALITDAIPGDVFTFYVKRLGIARDSAAWNVYNIDEDIDSVLGGGMSGSGGASWAPSSSCGGASVASSATSIRPPRHPIAATERASLLCGVRLMSGDTLFGGSSGGISLSHCANEASAVVDVEAMDADATVDFDKPLTLHVSDKMFCLRDATASSSTELWQWPRGAVLGVGFINAVVSIERKTRP